MLTLNAKSLAFSITLFILALALGACASSTQTPAGSTPAAASPAALNTAAPRPPSGGTPGRATPPPPPRTLTSAAPVALLLASLDDDRSRRIQAGFIGTARSMTTTVLFNEADNDAARQKAQVADALGQGAQVLVIQPVDSDASAAYVDAAHKAGARVVALDRLVNTRDLDAYVSYDEFREGQLQASEALRWLTANKVKTPWNFVLLEGRAGDSIAAEITRGYYDVLKSLIDKKQAVVVSDQAHSAGSSEQAAKTVQDALTKSNVHAVLANNSALAKGARQTLDQQKLLGRVFVAGAGAELENLRALCAGEQHLAVIEDIEPLAAAAAQLATALARGSSVGDTNLAQGTLTVADKQVPTDRIPVQAVTLDTAQATLIQSGRYTSDSLGKCMAPLAEGATVPKVTAQAKLVLWAAEDASVYAYVANLAAQFMDANPGVQISVANLDPDTLKKKVSSSAPDLLWAGNEQINQFTASDSLLAVDDLADMTQFLPPASAAALYKDKHYAFPLSVQDYLVLYYNSKLLKTPPADSDGLLKLKTITKADGSVWALVFDQSDPRLLIPWLYGFKGRLFASDGKTPSLNSTAMVDTLSFMKQLRDQKVAAPDTDAAAADNLFRQGKAAMIVAGDRVLNDYSAALGDNLGVARLPKVVKTGELTRPYAQGKFLMFSKGVSGDKLLIARSFAEFITSRPIQLDLTKRFRRMPALQAALNDAAIANDALLKPMADQALSSMPLPGNVQVQCVWDAIKSGIQPVLTGKSTPTDAAKGMQDAAEACIAKLE